MPLETDPRRLGSIHFAGLWFTCLDCQHANVVPRNEALRRWGERTRLCDAVADVRCRPPCRSKNIRVHIELKPSKVEAPSRAIDRARRSLTRLDRITDELFELKGEGEIE